MGFPVAVDSFLNQDYYFLPQDIAEINTHLHVMDYQLCKWAVPQYTDIGSGLEKTLWKAAMIAVATINTMAQIQIAEQRYELANDYLNIAKDRLNRFRNKYKPLEERMLWETPWEPVVDYGSAKRRPLEYVNDTFLFADKKMASLAKQYALCMDASLLDDLPYGEQLALDDGVNYNYRDDEYFRNIKSDQRWNRRSNLLNIGRENMSQSASYAMAANNALASVGELVSGGTQGAMQVLGYLSEIRETHYPSLYSSATPLTGQAEGLFGSTLSMGSTYSDGNTW